MGTRSSRSASDAAGANWMVHPEGCLAALKRMLDHMEIKRLGAEPPQQSWIDSK